MPGAEKNPIEVYRHHAPPVFQAHLRYWSGEGDAGAVYQNIETLVRRKNLFHGCLPIRFESYVEADGGCLLSIFRDEHGGILGTSRSDIRANYRSAVTSQNNSGGAANSGGRPRHQRDFACNPACM